MKRFLIFLTYVIASATTPTMALSPISESTNPSTYFLSTRCSGLFLALSFWNGSNAEGKEMRDMLIKNAQMTLGLAMLDTSMSDPQLSVEQNQSQAIATSKTARDMYLERFKKNYANSGQGYMNDAAVKEDILTCRLVLDTAKEVIQTSSKNEHFELNKPDETKKWVIQVGKFSNLNNAMKLIEALHNSGLDAPTPPEKEVISGKATYKVIVGPYLNKEIADGHVDSVRRISGTKAFVTDMK